MWPVIKVAAVFILIILMLRRKVGLGTTMMVSTAVLGFIFGVGALPLAKQYFLTLADPSTLYLISALVLIMVLESVMRRTGMLEALTGSLISLPLNPRVLIASISAIIGLLPSAGGARFSAPLVAQATEGLPYKAEDKVFINFWFRHIWEYSLPLYPGLLLAAQFSGIPLAVIISWQWPFTILWAVLGYWYVFRRYRGVDVPLPGAGAEENNASAGGAGKPLKDLAVNTWPLWLAVVLVLARLPVPAAIGIILVLLIVGKRYPLRSVWEALVDPMTARIVSLAWGTMVFKDVLELSGAVFEVSHSIKALGVPAVVVVTILPLAVGMLTGLVQACTGVSFPLVMAMVDPSIGNVVLAYVSGVVGVMVSPVHLCMILTVEYFKADFIKSYKPLFLPSSAVIAAAVLFSVLAL